MTATPTLVKLPINGYNAEAITEALDAMPRNQRPALLLGDTECPDFSYIRLKHSISGLVLGMSFHKQNGHPIHSQAVDEYLPGREPHLLATQQFKKKIDRMIRQSKEATYQPLIVEPSFA